MNWNRTGTPVSMPWNELMKGIPFIHHITCVPWVPCVIYHHYMNNIIMIFVSDNNIYSANTLQTWLWFRFIPAVNKVAEMLNLVSSSGKLFSREEVNHISHNFYLAAQENLCTTTPWRNIKRDRLRETIPNTVVIQHRLSNHACLTDWQLVINEYIILTTTSTSTSSFP